MPELFALNCIFYFGNEFSRIKLFKNCIHKQQYEEKVSIWMNMHIICAQHLRAQYFTFGKKSRITLKNVTLTPPSIN